MDLRSLETWWEFKRRSRCSWRLRGLRRKSGRFRDVQRPKLDSRTDYRWKYFVCVYFWKDFLIQMSSVWKSCRRLALVRRLAGVFLNVSKRSRCVKCHSEQNFPLTKQRRVTLVGEIQQRLVTFSDDEVKPTKRENVKSNFFEALVRKKNSHFFVDSPFVLWGMTDWFINVVIFYFLDSGTFSITAGF